MKGWHVRGYVHHSRRRRRRRRYSALIGVSRMKPPPIKGDTRRLTVETGLDTAKVGIFIALYYC